MRDTAVTSRGARTLTPDRLSYPASTPTRRPSEDSNRLSPGGLVSPRLYIQSRALPDIAFHLPAGRRCARAHVRRDEQRARCGDLGAEATSDSPTWKPNVSMIFVPGFLVSRGNSARARSR